MKRWIAPLTGLIIAGAVVVPAFAQSQPAESATQPDAVVEMRGAGAGLLICSTSNPTDTVAQALGMTASELRLALVSGQTVSEIAASKNVDTQVITDALTTQRKADLDQALKDGLLTQTQYDAITQALENAPALNGGAHFGLRVAAYNVVNREQAAADALGISCADLVKAQQAGSAIAEIAADKGVEVQSVIDAVTNAYKGAFAADVQEGLITQAQADGRLSRLTLEIGQWVYNARGGRGDGFGPGMGMGNGQQGGPGQRGNQDGMGQGGFGQRGNQNGMGQGGFGQQNNQQPEATTTPNS